MSDPASPSPTEAVPTCYRHPGREAYIRCQRCDRVICPDCMRDSAVGFQCPECIKEGARSTRSGRTAYGGLRPSNAGITSMVIIGINVLIWLMVVASGGRGSKLVDAMALSPEGRCDSLRSPDGYYPGVTTETVCNSLSNSDGAWHAGVADGAYWQLLSSAFLHEEIWHIGFNMLALWVLGPQLELAIGRVRFIALYLLSALAGSALVLWAAPENSSTLGASGAVFGLMGALLVMAFKVGGQVQPILVWIGINAVLTFTFGFSWQGHLGGFLGGLAIASVLVYAPRRHRARLQLAGVVVIGIAIVAATAARVVVLA